MWLPFKTNKKNETAILFYFWETIKTKTKV